jgi:hypothetical protein
MEDSDWKGDLMMFINMAFIIIMEFVVMWTLLTGGDIGTLIFYVQYAIVGIVVLQLVMRLYVINRYKNEEVLKGITDQEEGMWEWHKLTVDHYTPWEDVSRSEQEEADEWIQQHKQELLEYEGAGEGMGPGESNESPHLESKSLKELEKEV